MVALVIEDIKKRALHRSRILQGQLRGIEKMIENEDYCVDIITQSLAVQKSLRSLNKLLVENHLRTHVTDMFDAGGEEREKAMAELLAVFELKNNRGEEPWLAIMRRTMSRRRAVAARRKRRTATGPTATTRGTTPRNSSASSG